MVVVLVIEKERLAFATSTKVRYLAQGLGVVSFASFGCAGSLPTGRVGAFLKADSRQCT